ncbi:nucleoside transporter 1, putative [Plasmodium gallinaceum]|uniref:Nucleoside transporter 1, putative n=2 Tax=Plasmodium gallinaceum TaxID=5849 RepID=A0A1J1GRX0_PLAGA|nr:nucleoside transporter 1, putative [Plasmodium gallinaceum]CRG95178.1 nucleoside transporter 1, putative [Plasmodium gallinaceum]
MSTGKDSSKVSADIEMKEVYVDENKKSSKITSTNKRTLNILTFILIGLSSLNVWNTALGLNINLKYNTFQITGLVCSSIVALFIDIPKFLLPYFLGGLAILSAGFQITHQLLTENQFSIYCLITFVIIGIMAGLAQTIAFNIASTMEENMGGYMSTGIGISGVFIFVINLLLDQFVSSEKKYGINKEKLLYLYFICEICLVLAILLCVFNLELSKKKVKKDDEEISERSLSYMELIKDSYKAIISIFFVNMLTLQLFPGVGHKKWAKSHDISDYNVTIIVGMFQVFDFISRYPPNLSHIKYFKIFTFSLNKLLIANAIRIIFIPWFILNSCLKNSFFSNIVQHCFCMALFAFTNGWFNTVPFLVFVNELKVAKKPKDIETVSTFMVIAMFLGLCAGIWSTYIYDLFPIVIKM